MNLSTVLAKHFRAIHFGGNWTTSNLRDQLANVSYKDATTEISDCNTILALTFHVSYYVTGVLDVFNNKPLEIRDKFSYDHPKITSESEWQNMLERVWTNAEALAKHIEILTEDQLWQNFTDPKYGSYYSNITGIIEHTHYHLGQIAILKKLIKKDI
ncbi:DUF1572 domain-containing protein [uncultured Psychroserpens sp.]|uniref:DUF1572 domain-containing protein n=1 Tax=uncultured Psychroserpens sp. TaxID=255436 RepID=UPI002607764B|nr:DUF1572 domain-containing protein [uncultured Psychroserpens sp.]